MKNILIIAPHPDDELLGCGGIMLRHVAEGNNVFVCIVTHAEPPLYKEGASLPMQAAGRECHKWMGVKRTYFLDFPAVMLEKIDRYKLNDAILKVITETQADEVYIPHWGDMQKDHQIVTESCLVGVRPKYAHKVGKVYAYETLSETAWNATNVQNEFIPNTFVDISEYLERKIKALHYYSEQIGPFPDARSYEAVEALARYRGALMHMNAAEAFVLIREMR